MEIVKHLVSAGFVAPIKIDELFHIGDIEVADAPVANLACAHELLERFESLLQGNSPAPMQQVKVDLVDAKPHQAAVAGFDGSAQRRMMGEDLADQENLVAASIDRVSDEIFGGAVGVHFGGIDQSHAEFDAEAQRGDLFDPPARVLGHVPRALSEHGNGFAGWKTDRSYRGEHGHVMPLLDAAQGLSARTGLIMTTCPRRRVQSRDNAAAFAATVAH